MTRPYRIVLVALMGLLAFASMAPAFTAVEIRTVLAAGGMMTVDNRFTPDDVRSFATAGGSRLIVVAGGFTPANARTFLTLGAGLVLDSSFSADDLVNLAELGRQRVSVKGDGLDPAIIKRMTAAGAFLLAGPGGSTYGEKMKTLQAGGQAVVDSQYTVNDVAQLIAVGRARVHVLGKGFAPGNLAMFVNQGAIVWVDPSIPAPEILSMISQGNSRVIVRASGFSFDALRTFAQRGGHIVFAFDNGGREAKRAAQFDALMGE